MKPLWITASMLCFTLLSGPARAEQATALIVTVDGQEILAGWVLAGETEVLYRPEEAPNGPRLKLPIARVKEIRYPSGHVQRFHQTPDAANPRRARPFGVQLHLLGPGIFAGAAVNVFATPRLRLTAGGNPIAAHAGALWHFNDAPDRRWTVYAGVQGVAMKDFSFFDDAGDGSWSALVYAPVGLHYLGASGFMFSVEAAAYVGERLKYPVVPWLQIAVGWHF